MRLERSASGDSRTRGRLPRPERHPHVDAAWRCRAATWRLDVVASAGPPWKVTADHAGEAAAAQPRACCPARGALARGARRDARDLRDPRLLHEHGAAAGARLSRRGAAAMRRGSAAPAATPAARDARTAGMRAEEDLLAALARPLFLRPTGLADGLALKERRYGLPLTGSADSPLRNAASTALRMVPPLPVGLAARPGTRQALNAAAV